MEVQQNTIVALSSGALPSGVAIIRISGSAVSKVLENTIGVIPEPRIATLRSILNPSDGEIIDEGLVLFFPSPASFTGEDCAEFQIHGGRAVVALLLDILTEFEDVRLAEAGEFSRRAFENGKLDLTEIEGLSDLIEAETEMQRRLALSQSQGSLRSLYEGWRKQLIHLRAMIEAELDFSEEEDVPTDISEAGLAQVSSVVEQIKDHLDDARAGEIIRDGFSVALMGKPNAGKSSLLNALAKRDVAIVTDKAGTTRDIIEVKLNLNGHAVSIFDTAGIRSSDDIVEQEGVKRATKLGEQVDLVLWLREKDDQNTSPLDLNANNIELISKDDDNTCEGISFSSLTGVGINELFEIINDEIIARTKGNESGLITRKRYRIAIEEALQHLESVVFSDSLDIELRAESVRLAGDCLGRVTGRIDVEDLLDIIFAEFCVGK